MKTTTLTFILVCMFLFLYSLKGISQITRGASPGEIYISTDWYMDNYGQVHYAIFRSSDNGEHITLKYENIATPPLGEMKISRVLGDASPGAVYNWGWNELWVSFDYGESWEYKETYGSSGRFSSGCVNGEIYKCCVNSQGTIWRSNDYGNEFVEIRDDAKYVLEVGINEGEVYGRNGTAGVGYNLHYSTNYGLNFNTIPIDSSVAFSQIGGYYPQISRGTEPGEIFLVSWWPDYHYKIFHSVDTGYTWTEKYESDYIDIYFWRVAYTAGRIPGSFYVIRSRINPSGTHVWLYIDYSSDYGETFTTYFHDLDSLYTDIDILQSKNYKLKNYPNPFSEKTTIVFELPANCKNSVLSIFNIHGILIKEYELAGKEQVGWDGSGISGQKVESGIYLYRITSGRYQSGLNKIVYLNH